MSEEKKSLVLYTGSKKKKEKGEGGKQVGQRRNRPR